MNYYNLIKSELINNEVMKLVKTFSINKPNLNTGYNVGIMLNEVGKHNNQEVFKKIKS